MHMQTMEQELTGHPFFAGLATEYLFRAAGIQPGPPRGKHGMIGRDVWGWNYTAVLDIVEGHIASAGKEPGFGMFLAN